MAQMLENGTQAKCYHCKGRVLIFQSADVVFPEPEQKCSNCGRDQTYRPRTPVGDDIKRGGKSTGDKPGKSVNVTEREALKRRNAQIRRLRAKGWSIVDLAIEYSRSPDTIYEICAPHSRYP